MAPVAAALAALAIWSGHFESTFQDADFHVIVNNPAIQDSTGIPHFFTTPLLYADQPELAEYRPLALLSLAFDYWLAKPVNPAVFQADSFVWFLLGVLLFGILCLTLPGSNYRLAIAASALFAFHPLVGETLNYASRRGDLIGAAGLLGGLVFWILWPKYLPSEIFPWDRNRVPKTDWDAFRRTWSPIVNARYRRFVEAPLGLYLIPVVFALLAEPDAAVFPLLLLAWILLFERASAKPVWLRVLPSAILCGGFWATQLFFTWKYAAGYRLPALAYISTQPWVLLRYLGAFLLPIRITAESGLRAFAAPWDPRALAGFAGLAGLVFLAIRLAKRESWRIVSFGLWWFVITLLPTMLVPRRAPEADYRLYLPLMGLALAAAATGWHFYRRALASSRSAAQVNAFAITASGLVLVALCWCLVERNQVWQSQASFWEDAIEKDPRDGKASVALALALIDKDQFDRAGAELRHAAEVISGDAPDEIALALAFDRLNDDADAEKHLQLALKANPNYASAWSAWSRWLIARQRYPEAFQAASRAIQISPWNLEAKHTLLDYYSADSNWPELQKQANAVLQAVPTDVDARRALAVADTAFTQLKTAEAKAKSEPSVDDFLALSVEYFKNRRFQDSINACNQALKLRPDLAEAYNNMATAYHALGKDDDAIEALRQAVRVRPDLEIAKGNLQLLLARREENQKAPASGHP